MARRPRRRVRKKPFNRNTFYDSLTMELGKMAYRIAYNNIPSGTLRNAMVVLRVKSNKSGAAYKLFIPHYWATYVHDGRGTVRPRRGKWLVWFKDARKDPRNYGGYPIRLSDASALEMPSQEFRRKKSEMIFSKSAKPMRGSFFFSNQQKMSGFSRVLGPALVTRSLDNAVVNYLGDLWNMDETVSFSL